VSLVEKESSLAVHDFQTYWRCSLFSIYTLQGTNISHLGKRKIIFKMPFWGDMLVPWRVIGDKLIKPIVGVYMHISSDVFFWLVILLMVQKSSEPVEVGSLSHDLQGSMHPRWCRIASISRFQQ